MFPLEFAFIKISKLMVHTLKFEKFCSRKQITLELGATC